jgi:biopolymer transport protein ExbD|tara:strand:- start:229 stop:729 length:501 start_codon:yes stop_codon:yes gene_type:complete
MSKFNKNKKKSDGPGITTASLPDIVFMLLFFFMVTTKTRTNDLSISISLPSATETGILDDKTPTAYINIGVPVKALQELYGDNPRIQLNDAILNASDVVGFIENKRASIEKSFEMAQPGVGKAKASKMIVCLKVDQNAQLGTLDEVREELKTAKALKINYVVNKAN